MGFDRHFYEDHCYLDDPSDGVGMNVEIIEENCQVNQNNVIIEKPTIRYLDISGTSHSNMGDTYEEVNNYAKKTLIFLPYNEYCTDHAGLFLHEDEKLVKPGDKFSSHEDFVQYLNENAKRWCFYYRCSDSRKPNTNYETYTYNCVYLRNKEKYKKKGLRKRNNSMKTDCPCKIKLRHLPNEKELTVVYVCNHHDHELSIEEFYKLQHGRRLPPYVKEEIKDFLQLKVDMMKIKAYVEMETGFTMTRPFFYALEKNMKNRNVERHISEQRLMMLKQKLAAVDEMYGFNDDENAAEQVQSMQDHDTETAKRKQRRSIKNAEGAGHTPPLKRRSKANEATTSSDGKRVKVEEKHSNNTYNIETLQCVKNLQDSVKCEIQRNPWISDQCVPVLPNRTAVKQEPIQIENLTLEQFDEEAHLVTPNDIENLSYTIEYLEPDDGSNHEISSQELGEIVNDGEVTEVEGNDIDNIAYETVVTDNIDETQTEVHEYVDPDQIAGERIEIHIEQDNDMKTEFLDDEFDNTQEIVEGENHVEYITEDVTENNTVEYIEETNEDNSAQDVGVQTAENSESSTHALLPVFDVYMKDGNVTGFVVNDNVISGLKECVDKEVQTSEELILSDLQDIENEDYDIEIIRDITKSVDTFTKHEYVHKYNLDKYMVQPHFPKYVETLAKETYMDVLHMFTNIYNEKAMFKITTTQRGKEGNTRIWYVTDGPRSKKHRKVEPYSDRLGKNLQSVILLKNKLRSMKKFNNELLAKNKQLEEVALRLVEMT